MEEWTPATGILLNRRLTIYSYFNNYWACAGYASSRVITQMLDRTIGRQNAKIASPSAVRAQQTKPF